ncbi:hypothetical protein [Sphingosinithalassobacter sp. CS137]|uniref:hypothetical protein n=1 Tax=Sphingosinithalassobacter sp. CS137 TaxID=2762748 RepID=UPI0021D2EA9C|nr:hypothetical protein [Sphingosinithalassobacter sp. CS137]
MRFGVLLVSSLLLSGTALAQVAPDAPGIAQLAEREAASRAAYNALPDTPGTGPYPAVMEVVPNLSDHVVYRPAALDALGGTRLPVLVWGNGGCVANGASARFHLAEIASHGYLVVAPGAILSGPRAAAPPPPRRPDPATGTLPGVATTAEDVRGGIDWAIRENSRAGSPFEGRIDTGNVAVAGHSCGGLQALQVAGDPRVKTVIVHNSGVFTDGTNPIAGITVDKSLLETLHTPVLYVLGGEGDVAWPNGSDDYARITHVPAALVTGDVGHGGTFRQPNGGDVAQFSVDWLEWQLRGDVDAAKTFVGPECGLCASPTWTIERKGF